MLFKKDAWVKLDGDSVPWVVAEDQFDESVKLYNPNTGDFASINGSFLRLWDGKR